MNTFDLSGRRFLVTGATGGVGLAAARAVHARGAGVLIGTRRLDRYEAVAATLRGGADIHPFVADIGDVAGTSMAVDALVRQSLAPTDVIHSAAGGLESLLKDLLRISLSLRRLSGADLERAHTEAIAELSELSIESREAALDANFRWPSAMLDRLAPLLPRGGTISYFTSLWSSFQPHPQVPAFYRSLAESKQRMERRLESRAGDAWTGIRVIVVSSPVISDTRMGEIIDRHCATLMAEPDRSRWRATFVACEDVVDAMLDALASSGGAPGFERVFLPGDGTRVSHLSADYPTLQVPVAFAANSPRWAENPSAGSRPAVRPTDS